MFLQRVSLVVAVLCAANLVTAAENADGLAPLRIALVGDSTVASYPEPPADRPSLTGWGQVFEEFFSDRVVVLNHAVSGRSSKSFIGEGLWRKTLEAKPDYVLIQFGHNDQPDKGERSTDANTDYQEYLRQYVQDARAQGAIPILVTSVARRTFQDGKPQTTLQPYVDAMKKVGQELHVPVIDLHGASLAVFAELGDAGSADLSPSTTDRSHFSRKGARTMAKLVAEALPQVVPALQPYLVDIWFGNRVGITDVVPAPWTPVVVTGSAVQPWGRTYRFERSLLPTEIVTREASLLTAPIAIRGRAAGKPIAPTRTVRSSGVLWTVAMSRESICSCTCRGSSPITRRNGRTTPRKSSPNHFGASTSGSRRKRPTTSAGTTFGRTFACSISIAC
ncbi:MAG: rhamnogalacturonan acetylesterase [Pirellulaceae bacterium]